MERLPTNPYETHERTGEEPEPPHKCYCGQPAIGQCRAYECGCGEWFCISDINIHSEAIREAEDAVSHE